MHASALDVERPPPGFEVFGSPILNATVLRTDLQSFVLHPTMLFEQCGNYNVALFFSRATIHLAA